MFNIRNLIYIFPTVAVQELSYSYDTTFFVFPGLLEMAGSIKTTRVPNRLRKFLGVKRLWLNFPQDISGLQRAGCRHNDFSMEFTPQSR